MNRQPGEKQRDTAETGLEPSAIVGIGASAGGLKAITALLAVVPKDSRLAFVVIQHRTPDNEELFTDLLSKITPLPVHAAVDGTALKTDHIYVAPAGRLTTMKDGRLRIRMPQPSDNAALPIDLFLRTLAADQREKAIGVILSGSGADGTYGLRSIKEYGGLVVVQDPATAAFDGMPCNAIATGMADYVLAPPSIPAALIDYVRQPYLGPVTNRKNADDDDDDDANPAFPRILALLAAQTKRDHRAYKAKTLARRIERRMGIHKIAGIAEYLAFLGSHPAEIEQLSRDVLISVTRFFRDVPAFEALATDVIGPLVGEREAGRPVRVWVPACATGEEVLSIGEEYQSTTEELETSKEELQSLNEELSTLNAQLHEKVEELEATTNDLTNLLSSSDIATVFLSPDLRIKRFTPTTTRLFSLLPQDIGRPIVDISRHFADPDLIEDTHASLASLASLEREVAATGDATFLRRIQPYRTQDERIEGTVITFSDVTALKRTSLTLALRARQHKLIADLGRLEPVGPDGPDRLADAARLIAEGLAVDGVAILGGSGIPGSGGPSGDATGLAGGLTLLGAAGLPASPDGAGNPFPPDPATLVGRAFLSRQPLIVADFAADPRVRSTGPWPDGRAASGLGVVFGDRSRGPFVLALSSRKHDRFSESDIDFVQAVASMLGVVLERARILNEARADRDFAEAIVNTVREPLLVLDDALRVVAASAAFHRAFGSTPATTLAHPLWTVAAGSFADPALRTALERVIPDDSAIEALEIVIGPGPGEQRILLNARRMSQGNLILLAMENVTERTRVREALAAAKLAAEQASASKTRFLAAASHDLRQPAQALMMFQHLLSLQPMTGTATRLLSDMGHSLGALTSMPDDILDVSRLDAGIIEVSPRSCRLHPMLAALCAETAPLAEAAGLALRCVPTSLIVRSDPALLVRILRNFLANAVKYTDSGRILMGCRRSGHALRIQVWDTGQGIPHDQLSVIFEEFHQVGNLERDRRKGLGLGLAIVERLAGLLGHPIQVRSRVGAGSVFEVLVPLANPEDPVPADDEAVLYNAGNGERVLVIDDDPAILAGIRAFLTEEGYHVIAAPDSDTAMDRLEDHPPDLVIADFRQNGAEAIRRLERWLQTSLLGILLTGDTSPVRIREAIDSGFLLLHKPLSPEGLLRAVRRALS